MVPRVAEFIFSHCDESKNGIELYVSFLEIYQEKLKDLLQKMPSSSSTSASFSRGLRIRETAKTGIWIEVTLQAFLWVKLEYIDIVYVKIRQKKCWFIFFPDFNVQGLTEKKISSTSEFSEVSIIYLSIYLRNNVMLRCIFLYHLSVYVYFDAVVFFGCSETMCGLPRYEF